MERFDLNHNGVVESGDLMMLFAYMDAADDTVDFNDDGKLGAADCLMFSEHWGEQVPSPGMQPRDRSRLVQFAYTHTRPLPYTRRSTKDCPGPIRTGELKRSQVSFLFCARSAFSLRPAGERASTGAGAGIHLQLLLED